MNDPAFWIPLSVATGSLIGSLGTRLYLHRRIRRCTQETWRAASLYYHRRYADRL